LALSKKEEDLVTKLEDMSHSALEHPPGKSGEPTSRQGASATATPAYMAPEQIEGSDVSERTDIYAFGIVLYEMLSGAVPFRAPTPAAVLTKHLREVPTPLRKLRRELPAALEREVSRALEKSPERRQQNFRGVIDVLRSLQFDSEPCQTRANIFHNDVKATIVRLVEVKNRNDVTMV
jgi:serine/threonine protein kinase